MSRTKVTGDVIEDATLKRRHHASEETQQDVSNNTTADITGMTLNKSDQTYYKFEMWVRRRDEDNIRLGFFTIEAFYETEGDEWHVTWQESYPEEMDRTGLTFAVDNTDTDAAQVSYTSDNLIALNYEGKARWKIVSTIEIES